jgi:hypothetical protein
MSADAPNPPEGFHYGGKYGWVYQDSKSFDDMQNIFKEKYLQQKIIKLKIWSGKKDGSDVIYGIQAFYKNINTGKLTITDEYKGDGFQTVEEFNIKSNEYLNKFYVRFDTEITRVGFETNKGNKFIVGDGKGEDKYIKINDGNNIIITIYGCYNKYLEAIGVGYVERNLYLKKMCFGYFELRFKFKKDENFKNEWLKKYDNLNLFEKALLKTCILPDAAFTQIIRFCF